MKELVVISGKGGTGKTSLLAAFAALADNAVFADCDVDAADLHLLLAPRVIREEEFRSGREAVIRPDDCIGCGACLAYCRFGAVKMNGARAGEATFTVDPFACEGCGVCVRFCPENAIDFPERSCGKWFVSETRFGPMVHARLGIAAENSGKLVSTVRREARLIAEKNAADWILVDGPPGIGCPVIASVTGAAFVLVVTEPTLSGEHDLQRVLGLARHFRIPSAVCVNKWDINPEMADRIERTAAGHSAPSVGRIPYDDTVTNAQVAGRTVLEYADCPASQSIKEIWRRICTMIP